MGSVVVLYDVMLIDISTVGPYCLVLINKIMGKRVMAVDDSATVRKVLQATLVSAGYEVVEAPSEATYLIQINHLSLVETELLDGETVEDAIGSAMAAPFAFETS